MNSNYKKSVVVFGVFIPVGILLALAVFIALKASSIHQEYEAKVALQKKDRLAQMQNEVLNKKVATQQKELGSWTKLLAQEDRRTFLEHWKEVRKKFKAKEFTGERPVWKNASTGLGLDVKHPSSEVILTFDATYRAMQLALLEVETKLPQMQLESLEMKPNTNGGTIHFTTRFTVWTAK